MRSTLLSVALIGLSAPLALFGCDSGDGDDPLLGGETVGDGATADGGEGETGGETGDTAGEELGCNVETPYMGGWDIGCCQEEIVPGPWSPGGVYAGTIMPDWTFTDQFGESVRLYDFCHEAIYFEYVALW